MEFALGVLRWSPADFWNSTPLELTSAYVGYCRREGIGRWQPDPAGFNFESAAAAQKEMDRLKKAGLSNGKLSGVTKAERAAYKANRRAMRERGQLGGYTH